MAPLRKSMHRPRWWVTTGAFLILGAWKLVGRIGPWSGPVRGLNLRLLLTW